VHSNFSKKFVDLGVNAAVELFLLLKMPGTHTEPVFLNVYGAQKSIPRINSASLCSLAGQYDNPIPTRFLAPIDCLKIPAQ
jgi:hypothetical protein